MPDDNRSPGEECYDEEIMPRLQKIAELCIEKKMAFISNVQYDPQNSGTIVTRKDDQAIKLIRVAILAHGNIDRLFLGILRLVSQGEIDGSNSLMLRVLLGEQDDHDPVFDDVARVTGVN